LRAEGWVADPDADATAFLAQVVPVAASAVDRLDQVPSRLAFLFDYSATRALDNPDILAEATAAMAVIDALAAELEHSEPMLDREAFRAMAGRVRDRSGQKGKALFHPIRLALTGEPEGLELDIAVPAIERGARISSTGFRSILSAAARARAFREVLVS
jgi:hypothetical protein